MKPTVLITGANRGIGFEIARQLLDKGCRVIVSGRDKSALEDAKHQLSQSHGDVESLVMDVASDESVDAAWNEWKKGEAKIDVLINNAGILLKEDRLLSNDDESLLQQTIAVNCLGVLRVAKAFLPAISRPGGIINISSGGGSMTDPVGGWAPAYCASKAFLNAITRQLAHELNGESIAVNAVCPGWVRTGMGGKSAPRAVEKGAETPVWLATEAAGKHTGKFFRDKRVIPW